MTPNQNPAANENVLYYFSALRQNISLTDCLISMQLNEGIDEFTAEANAEECMAAISVWDSVHSQISDNAMAVMEDLLKALARMEYDQRLTALQKIHFGLTVWEDPDSARLLEEGIPVDRLFWEHTEALRKAGTTPTCEELEAQIRTALSAYSLSPACMRLLTLKMRCGAGYLASAEALGEEGRNLKCLMTMDLWLRNRDTMTLTEAAAEAATDVQTQAVEDALQRGYITRDVAKMILIAVGITLAVIGVIYIVQSLPAVASALSAIQTGVNPTGAPMSPLLRSLLEKQASQRHLGALTFQGKGALLTLAGGAMALLSDKGADLIARLGDHFSHLIRKTDKVSDTLDTLADTDVQSGDTVYASYPEELDIPQMTADEAEDDMLIF